MEFNNIEDVVRQYVTFRGSPSGGWNHCYCEYCGDGKREKGPRGNWLFSDDMAFYNCWNCGTKASFDPRRDIPFSKDMHGIFKSFGIPLRECYALIPEKQDQPSREVKKQKLHFNYIDMPDHFYPLIEAKPNDKNAMAAIDHLENVRRINPASGNFYLSTGVTKSGNPKDITMARTFKDRLIIPSFVNDRLIGYQGMALYPSKTKYITIGNNLIHGYSNIFSKENHIPLYITEGYFDSYYLNGVAVLTNSLSNKHIELLEKTSRPKVVVPDRKNSHNALAETAIELGWGVSLPDIKPYKDISEAVKDYGVFYVVKSVVNSIKYGDSAKISLKFYNIL